MSLAEEWDHELHRAEAILEEEDRRINRLRSVEDERDDDVASPSTDEG